MAQRHFILTSAQATALHQAYLQTKDGPTRSRDQAVRLYGSGYSVAQVIDITGCTRTSLMDWCRVYRRAGLAGLVDGRVGGNRAKLTPEQRRVLCATLPQYTPRQLFGTGTATPRGQFWTVPDLTRAVAHWFGVTWNSHSSYRSVFAACGFSYQRTQKVFKSRSDAQVMTFEEALEKNSLMCAKTPRKQ
jgi:transposase